VRANQLTADRNWKLEPSVRHDLMGLSCNVLTCSSSFEYFDCYGCEQRRSFHSHVSHSCYLVPRFHFSRPLAPVRLPVRCSFSTYILTYLPVLNQVINDVIMWVQSQGSSISLYEMSVNVFKIFLVGLIYNSPVLFSVSSKTANITGDYTSTC